MSPNNPSNFVSDLVEMAKAFEELPRVREALDIANDAIEDYAKQVQRLELKLLDRNSEIEAAKAIIRKVEAERDEAINHFLEADDRTARALDFIKATFGNAGSLIQALEPPRVDADKPVDFAAKGVTNPDETAPKPYLEQTSEGVPFRTIYSPEPEPTKPIHDSDCATHNEPAYPNGPCDCSASQPAPEVVAQPDPTPAPIPNLSSASLNGDTDASSVASPSTDGPAPNAYAGRTYSEVAKTGHYPSRDEWHAGGGTVDNWYA